MSVLRESGMNKKTDTFEIEAIKEFDIIRQEGYEKQFLYLEDMLWGLD